MNMVIKIRKRKTVLISKIKKLAAVSVVLTTALGSLTSGIGYLALGPLYYSKHKGQYWEYIDDKNTLVEKLNGKTISVPQSDNSVLFASRPDPSIIRKWPVSLDNSIRVYTSDEPPMEILTIAPSREFISPDELPRLVKRALTLVEDKNFYEHHGINFIGKLRALYEYIFNGRITAGSGITEQVAKLIFTKKGETANRRGKSGIFGKIAEMLYARKIDGMYTKDQLIAFHQNVSYFGDGNYGIKAAAHDYFNKEFNQLTLCEALFLERLIQNPGKNPKNGGMEFQRRKYENLLKSLKKSNDLTDKEYQGCSDANATLVREIMEKYGINISGMIRDTERPYSIYFYTTIIEDEVKMMESAVRRSLRHETANLGFVTLDNQGKIVGILAGRNFSSWSDYNRAVQTNTQVGSTIKPLIYAIGYNQDIVLPSDIFNDSRDGVFESPDNWDEIYGRELTLEKALYTSNNVITRKVWDKIRHDIGFNGIMKYFEMAGLNVSNFNVNPNDTTIALGSRGGSPLDIASVYSTFFDGTHVNPTIIDNLQIGDITIRPERKRERVFRRLATDAVKRSLRVHGKKLTDYNNVSLKTGTTNNFREAWTAGLVDNAEGRAFALLVMNDDREELGTRAYGRIIAQPVVKSYLDQYFKGVVYKPYVASKHPVPTPIHVLGNNDDELGGISINEPEISIPAAEHYDAEIQEPTEDREVMVIDEKYEICNLDRSELNQKLQIRDIGLLYRLRNDMLECMNRDEEGTESWMYYLLVSAKAAGLLSRMYYKEGENSDNRILLRNTARNEYDLILDKIGVLYPDIRYEVIELKNDL